MSKVVCPHCQAKNEEGIELCVACGEPLSTKAQDKPAGREEVEQWVRQLPEFGMLDSEKLAHDDESLPAWLAAVRAHADKLSEEDSNELLDFLAELEPSEEEAEGEPEADEAAAKENVTGELPDWVAALMPEEGWPETEDDKSLANHFAEAAVTDEERLPSTGPLPTTRPLGDSAELEGIPELLAAEDLPDWLADQTREERPPESEEPPGWQSEARRMAPGPAEPAGYDEPTPTLETLDSVLDEVAESAMDTASAEPAADGSADWPPVATEDTDDLADWMDPTQTAALEATLEDILELPEADTSEGRVDQWLDILEGLPGEPETGQPDQVADEPELQDAEVPDWMESLQPGGRPEAVDEGPAEEIGPLAGIRGIVPAATLSLSGAVDRSAVRLEMTKEQRQQAALLRRLTTSQPEAAVDVAGQAGDSFLTLRLVLGLALVAVILLGLLAPGVVDLLPQPADPTLAPAAAQAHEAVTASAGRTALVAFDYTPTMAGELDAVARVILADLAANDVSALAVSQIAAGLPLAEQALADTEDLNAQSAGFVPGEAAGLWALGRCLDLSCDTLAGRPLSSETQAALADVSLIIVLTADRDSLAGWIEQVGVQSEIPIIGGVTQALGPVARPYVQSQQLTGLVEGLPESVAYAETASLGEAAQPEQVAGLMLAQWLAIGALVAGAIYFGVAAPAASTVSQVAKK